MYIYETKFKLSHPVNDLEAARKYLTEDPMIQYLDNDDLKRAGDPKSIRGLSFEDGHITDIVWDLQDESSGVIRVVATCPLHTVELTALSSWIKGQCSDGLGEGFEQQKFATHFDQEGYNRDWEEFCNTGDDDAEEIDEDCYYAESSFDWRTNDYKLELVSSN